MTKGNKNKWWLNGGRGSGRTFRLFCEVYENRITTLEKENAELKEKVENLQKYLDTQNSYRECVETWLKLTKAKDLIKNIIRVTWGEGWNYSLDWKVKAEQFLNEVEK